MKKLKMYSFQFSMSEHTYTRKFISTCGETQVHAWAKARKVYEEIIGTEKLKRIYEAAGLPGGFSPYFSVLDRGECQKKDCLIIA